jgi:hypothetical protein
MSELLDYDKEILTNVRHIEDVLVKFSLQNYASAGAVWLAYYSPANLSITIASWAVLVIGVVFLIAIGYNVYRYQRLFRIHKITRDLWLKQQGELQKALLADPPSEKYLAHSFQLLDFYPVYLINLLPAASAILGFTGKLDRVAEILVAT